MLRIVICPGSGVERAGDGSGMGFFDFIAGGVIIDKLSKRDQEALLCTIDAFLSKA